MRKAAAIPLSLLGLGAAGLGYATVIERNAFRLRRFDVPVLPRGRRPVRVLHLSDLHLTPRRRRLIDWVRSLGDLRPDLVVNTGDSIAHPDAVPSLLHALEPLLARPGIFVYGSNDLYSPAPRNPARYLWRTSKGDRNRRTVPDLPWDELGAGMAAEGWLDLNNTTARMKVGDLDVAVGGIHDSHIDRDRYDLIAGPAPADADLRLGVMHSPEPRNLTRFAADGYQLLLAGHTHGGQICVPFYGALVTNCGIDRARAKGLHRHDTAWLHVSAGLGTNPYAPARFACYPEATLLTLVPHR
ncbi:putative MPP superfamily phosphohydrolase [Thermocatellispora tengchongensis]|uniref:Putative MPP superfamily phosphohydrolase n=1 Tax=Thermocatellispora tengchongensis TaxID=1073253 RepID=A0A840PI85_9ACTN|nr:metallophosphoesterase [Thermocatellispora tengchongensis]MBB5137613.1 putative MPP superfamily phosphohydrolase [Thermocatellispora tengchongensis]